MRTILSSLWLLAVVSLAGDSYLERGFPAHDREWLPADYVKAAELFRVSGAELPMLSDKMAAPYLARLNSAENFATLRNKKVALPQRMSGFSAMQQAHTTILKLYGAGAGTGKDGKKYPAEVAGLIAFQLRLSVEGLVLMDEFVPTIPKDEKYEVRMAGLRKVHSGLATLFQGAITTLGETETYSAADRSLILKATAEVTPALVKIFTPVYKDELKKSLGNLKTKFEDGADRKLLEEMIRVAGE